MNQTKIMLFTAFEPFDGAVINESAEVLKALPPDIWVEDSEITLNPKTSTTSHITAHYKIHKLLLPVSFQKSAKMIIDTIQKLNPDYVISLGLAAKRTEICFERVALNLIDARIPDNDGEQPIDEPIFTNSPNAFFTTLPIKSMIAHANKVAPSKISDTAGTYVCNSLMYSTLHYGEGHCTSKKYKSGFIHIPPNQVIAINLVSKAIIESIKGI